MASLPPWASVLKCGTIKDNFVHGFVECSEVDGVLELHGRACLTDYVKR